jgi:hypothetical protein
MHIEKSAFWDILAKYPYASQLVLQVPSAHPSGCLDQLKIVGHACHDKKTILIDLAFELPK